MSISTTVTAIAATLAVLPIVWAVPAGSQAAKTTFSDTEIRDILASVRYTSSANTIREAKDEEGLTSFHVYEGERLVLSVYQYTDAANGPVTSLGLTIGRRAERKLEPSLVNKWNATRRFTKAFLDEEGDPMLSSDLTIKGGVTPETVREWTRSFASSAKEYETFVATGGAE